MARKTENTVSYNVQRLVSLNRSMAVALDKAEKRGRRKALKHCPRITKFCKVYTEPPPFDAEKVKALILELVSTTFDLGTTTYVKLSPEKRAKHYVVLKRRQAALHSLLHELGIDNG